jgi:DNA-binding NarL/FixJ family response regulator
MKVLILDDDELVAGGLKLLLEEEGVEVVVTTSPFEVPFLLRRERPDVALIDLQMPALKGEKVFELLPRSLRDITRMVVFSGMPNGGRMARAVGADGYISKGEDVCDIVARIRALCA